MPQYGKLLFMTDQDLDGSHIKGLGINLFDSEWASLLTLMASLALWYADSQGKEKQ